MNRIFIIRKIAFIFLTLLLPFFPIGQNLALNNLWIGGYNNYIKIDSDVVRVNYSWEFQGKKHFIQRAYRYFFIKDTFRVVGDNSIDYDFLIKELSNEKLEFVGLDPNSRLLSFQDSLQKSLIFRSQDKIATDTIRFEKLLFQATNCYGSCPAMIYQIDNSKEFKFEGEKFAIKQGFYKGVIPDKVYSDLLSILAISELDKIENNGTFNIDAPTYTIELHYNNNVKFIKTAFLPLALERLLTFLMALPNKVELLETRKEEFRFSQ